MLFLFLCDFFKTASFCAYLVSGDITCDFFDGEKFKDFMFAARQRSDNLDHGASKKHNDVSVVGSGEIRGMMVMCGAGIVEDFELQVPLDLDRGG